MVAAVGEAEQQLPPHNLARVGLRLAAAAAVVVAEAAEAVRQLPLRNQARVRLPLAAAAAAEVVVVVEEEPKERKGSDRIANRIISCAHSGLFLRICCGHTEYTSSSNNTRSSEYCTPINCRGLKCDGTASLFFLRCLLLGQRLPLTPS